MTDDIVRAIDEAEIVADPLDGLVARAAEDGGAPFDPAVLRRLAALKQREPAAFESLRAQLRKAGCRVGALDAALSQGGERRATSQADVLVELAAEAELFRSPDGTAFADVVVEGHRQTWPLRGRGFRHWLTRRFYDGGGAAGGEAMNAAINLLEARAMFDAPVRAVHVRVGGHDGRLYLDLGDDSWRAVEIDAEGWRIVESPPLRFRRGQGMQALPAPEPGGSIETLRRFLNVRSDSDFTLAVAWALGVLRGKGPYPVLVLSGEQGSAKSTFSAILRALIDPMTAPLRTLPREERDLYIAACNGHLLAFDNLSGLPPWMSDTLCRLASGAGFAVRQLYTDQDEILFDAARPVILNGIEDIVARPDLADRALFLTLEPIPEERRLAAEQLWLAFEAERAKLLGVLLDALSHGLRTLPATSLPRLPRMADFALWASACEGALWAPGTFWPAYDSNRKVAAEDVLDADPVAAAVLTMQTVQTVQTVWTGTCSDLLTVLTERVGERVSRSRGWPDSPRKLGGRLRRVATFLRQAGVTIEFQRTGRLGTRQIRLSGTPTLKTEEKAMATSAPSAPPADPTATDTRSADDMQTVGVRADVLPSADDEPLGWSMIL